MALPARNDQHVDHDQRHHLTAVCGGHFAVLPAHVLKNPDLSIGARALYALRCTYADINTGEHWPTDNTLAGELGVSVRTIKTWNAELKAAGLLEKRGIKARVIRNPAHQGVAVRRNMIRAVADTAPKPDPADDGKCSLLHQKSAACFTHNKITNRNLKKRKERSRFASPPEGGFAAASANARQDTALANNTGPRPIFTVLGGTSLFGKQVVHSPKDIVKQAIADALQEKHRVGEDLKARIGRHFVPMRTGDELAVLQERILTVNVLERKHRLALRTVDQRSEFWRSELAAIDAAGVPA